MRKAAKYIIGFFMVVFLIMEWAFDLITALLKIIHEAVKELATALQIKYSDLKQVKGEPDSGKK